ncbi:hypothetical protein GQ43DRAFT_435117 [Delitschia confertaspora ATCC 74209]|uniref:Uncharacterized protein n=1 Tax=Delitschia confertaspora ATCC 74209 TaxID=1513339 RepID=A0A9P4JJ61_9PLEO|nr:hypothetical protein GQ43DRAFT_435117 [Delitschia confertaspora ATCC 74209]
MAKMLSSEIIAIEAELSTAADGWRMQMAYLNRLVDGKNVEIAKLQGKLRLAEDQFSENSNAMGEVAERMEGLEGEIGGGIDRLKNYIDSLEASTPELVEAFTRLISENTKLKENAKVASANIANAQYQIQDLTAQLSISHADSSGQKNIVEELKKNLLAAAAKADMDADGELRRLQAKVEKTELAMGELTIRNEQESSAKDLMTANLTCTLSSAAIALETEVSARDTCIADLKSENARQADEISKLKDLAKFPLTNIRKAERKAQAMEAKKIKSLEDQVADLTAQLRAKDWEMRGLRRGTGTSSASSVSGDSNNRP